MHTCEGWWRVVERTVAEVPDRGGWWGTQFWGRSRGRGRGEVAPELFWSEGEEGGVVVLGGSPEKGAHCEKIEM